MQGVWVASNSTPLQRPPGFTTLVIDEAQAAKLLAALDARAEDRNTPTEPTEYFDALSIEPIRGELRSSLIVDPPNGLIPGNDLYKQHIAQAMASVLTAMDGPEQRPAPERCLASQTTQPPILSIRNGVNLHQIVQTADSFVFVVGVRRRGAHRSPELETPAGSDHFLAGRFDRPLGGRCARRRDPRLHAERSFAARHLRTASWCRRERS